MAPSYNIYIAITIVIVIVVVVVVVTTIIPFSTDSGAFTQYRSRLVTGEQKVRDCFVIDESVTGS